MTAKACTEDRATASLHRHLQLALNSAKLTFREVAFNDVADGRIRIHLGRVGIRTAARSARAPKVVRA